MAEHITLDALMQSKGHTALQVQEPASVEAVRAQVEEIEVRSRKHGWRRSKTAST